MPNTSTVPNATSSPALDGLNQANFLDRRQSGGNEKGIERRQFGNSYRELSEPGRELAEAIDAYKVQHRRRYITTDEMLDVIRSLGYSQD